MQRLLPILLALCAGCASLQPPTPDATGEVRVADEKLFFESFGKRSDPTGARDAVVLIHGGGVDRRVWDGQIDALSERYFVVRYDRRGYGRSSAPAGPFSDTADLFEVLDHLGLGAAHVIASSAGADVAVEAALAAPQRIHSLTLVGPTLNGYRYSGHETQLVDAIFRTAQKAGTDAAIESWIAKPGMFATENHASTAPSKLRELLQQNRQVFTFPWNLRQRAERVLPLLSEIECPTLVVCGREDSADHRVLADLLVDRLPTAWLSLVPEAGHMAQLEQPGEFNQKLLGFLRAHRQAGR